MVVDEAAQSVELSTLIPLRFGCRQCVLVGDPQQLPATVFSRMATTLGYGQSLFQRLQNCGSSCARLPGLHAHLSHHCRPRVQDIQATCFVCSTVATQPSPTFHLATSIRQALRPPPALPALPLTPALHTQSKLVNGPNVSSPHYTQPFHAVPCFGPLSFFHLPASAEERSASKSLRNVVEAAMVVRLVCALRAEFPHISLQGRVGVITPYGAWQRASLRAATPRLTGAARAAEQVTELVRQFREALGPAMALEGVEVNTVDGYQVWQRRWWRAA